jgi:hypothetical protein
VNHQDTKTRRAPITEETDSVAAKIEGATFAAHTALGPGLLESIDELCWSNETVLMKQRIQRITL